MNNGRFKLLATILTVCTSSPAMAERVHNPIAIFNGLDKITGVITTFEVKVGMEYPFGGLVVKPNVCNTSSITEQPNTTAFVEVNEIESAGSKKKIFSGWMFAESPGLNAVEHPIFDVWLIACKDPNAPPPPVETKPIEPEVIEEEDAGDTVQDD